MRRKKLILMIPALFLLIASAPFVITTRTIDWWAIGPGSQVLQSEGIELTGMIGQGVAGIVTAGNAELCSGYLCLWEEFLTLVKMYLPLIFR